MSTKIIKPKFSHLFWPFFFVDLILLFLLYGSFSSRFSWAYLNDGKETSYIIQDIIVIAIWVVLSIILGFVLFKKNYYEITKTSLLHTTLEVMPFTILIKYFISMKTIR